MNDSQIIVDVGECACCGANPDPAVPPYKVFQPKPLHLVSRRSALGVTLTATMAGLLTACAGQASTPTAETKSAPAPIKPAAEPTKPAIVATKPAVMTSVAETTVTAQASNAAATRVAETPKPAANATTAPAAQPKATGPLEKVELAFCSQVLCILPYEVARRRGFWEAEGLDVNLVYMKGGAQAMNALLANSIEWVGTPMDLVVQAAAKEKKPVMLVSTAQLPFFALVAGPQADVASVKELAGKKIGVANLNTTDHLMAQFLLKKEGVDLSAVEFVALGPNLYDLVVKNQVAAGMVQDPSLTLIERAGGNVLVNFMSLKDANQYLGGPYQFMGLNTRPDVLEAKPETARKLIRGLVKANGWIRNNSGSEIVKAAPAELVAGGDLEIFATTLDKVKNDLYPADGVIDEASVKRVIEVQEQSGVLKDAPPFEATDLFTNRLIPS